MSPDAEDLRLARLNYDMEVRAHRRRTDSATGDELVTLRAKAAAADLLARGLIVYTCEATGISEGRVAQPGVAEQLAQILVHNLTVAELPPASKTPAAILVAALIDRLTAEPVEVADAR